MFVAKSGFGNNTIIQLWEILFKNPGGDSGVVRVHGTNKAVAASVDRFCSCILLGPSTYWWKTGGM